MPGLSLGGLGTERGLAVGWTEMVRSTWLASGRDEVAEVPDLSSGGPEVKGS